MPRPRSRRLRAILYVLAMLAITAGVAQLAGVTRQQPLRPTDPTVFSPDTSGTVLVRGIDEAKVRMAISVPSEAGATTRSSKRGDTPQVADAGGGWSEVDVTAGDSEAAVAEVLMDAGATDVEPVEPRALYSQTDSPESGAPLVPAPNEIVDGPEAFEPAATPPGLRANPADAPKFAEQWALDQVSDADLDGPEAWRATTGTSTTVVAVIDSGVDGRHPDLAGQLVPGRDFSGSSTGALVDRVGHGTMVASVIAGAGEGMTGIAPGVRIMPLKVFADSGLEFSMSGYLQAIRYAADNGADVINISLGCGGSAACFSQAEHDALAYAQSKGVLIVTAAGNGDRYGKGIDNDDAATPDYPSGYELEAVISATSSTRESGWSPWANHGASTVDIAAPGEDIVVARSGGSWGSVSGTSFSAPYVGGVAALVESIAPGIGVGELRGALFASAVPSATLAGRTVTGGVANADLAIRAASNPAATPATPAAQRPAAAGQPSAVAPAEAITLPVQPTLRWSVPRGWQSSEVRLRRGSERFDTIVPGSRRVFAPPATAWETGTWRWQVVARGPGGAIAASPWRSYELGPRHVATVRGGLVSNHGRRLRLRVAYQSNTRNVRMNVVIRAGTREIHSGPVVTQRAHLRSRTTPRAGVVAYDAALSTPVRIGERITVRVTLEGAGVRSTWSVRGSVS